MSAVDPVEVSRAAHQFRIDYGRNAHLYAARIADEASAAGNDGDMRFWRAVSVKLTPRLPPALEVELLRSQARRPALQSGPTADLASSEAPAAVPARSGQTLASKRLVLTAARAVIAGMFAALALFCLGLYNKNMDSRRIQALCSSIAPGTSRAAILARAGSAGAKVAWDWDQELNIAIHACHCPVPMAHGLAIAGAQAYCID
jgi:hypothetical protein